VSHGFKTHWTEAKSLGLKKLSRTAANPAMEGVHTPPAESITIPRKTKTKQNKREKDRASTPQKRN
jgi:hypothetical protein